MFQAVHHQTVINLVREKDQLMLPGNLYQLLQKLLGVQRTGGVVGIDDNQRLGHRGDLALDILYIGTPIRAFIADVMHRLATGQVYTGGPKRIVRAGNQHFVTAVQKGVQRKLDQL